MQPFAELDSLAGSTLEHRWDSVRPIDTEGSEIDGGHPELLGVSGVEGLQEGPPEKGREMQMEMDQIGVRDVGLDDEPPPEAGGAGEEGAGPQWIEARIWEHINPRAEVWVHRQAEEQPAYATLVRAAAPLPKGAPAIRLVTLAEPSQPAGQLPAPLASAADGLANLLADTVTQIGSTLSTRLAAVARRGRKAQAVEQPPSEDTMARVEPGSALPDDAYVHQDTGLVDKKLYLRLARRRAFPNRREGRRVVARWGDVKAALQPPPAPTATESAVQPIDELDQYRRAMGLAPKARKQG